MKNWICAGVALGANLWIALWAVPGAGAQAQLQAFQTPSHNIGCIGVSAVLRCDILRKSWSGPKRPASCPLAYGDSLSLTATGRSYWTCHGDTSLHMGPVLAYGQVWRYQAFTCTSWPEGPTCTNRLGHGFFLSRETYRTF